MPSLQIFGEKIEVPQGGFNGPLGGMANVLVISTQKQGDKTMLVCSFEGKLPLGTLGQTSWDMECSIEGGAFVPHKAVLTSGGRLHVDDLGFSARDTQIIDASLSRRPGQSVTLGTNDRMLNFLLSQMTGGGAVRIDQASHADEDFWIAPDFRGLAFTFEPKGYSARVSIKHYYDSASGRFESEQGVAFAAVHVTSTAILLQGRADRLYVHGDLVDKRPSTTDNQVFFQHALVNGELHVAAQLTQLQMLSLNWAAQAGSTSPPVLLALRWRDENGHPLAFHPTAGAFTLTERLGFTDVPDGDLESIELTNQTVGVTSKMAQSWALRALDPVAHYRQDENLHGEYGPVMLAGAPQEIHGLASGVVLQVPTQGFAADLPCEFNCKEVRHHGHVIASLPEITLGGSGPDWALRTFLEERDSRAGAALSTREAPGKKGARGPVLPLVDPQPMGVNLHPPASIGPVAYEGRIVEALSDWLGDHDRQFVGAAPQWLDAPPLPRAAPQVHRTGFALMPGTEKLSCILGQLRITGSLDELVPASPRLDTATPIAFHMLEATPVTGYVHGLDADADFAANVQRIEQRLAKTPIWNDAWVRVMNQWVSPPAGLVAVFDEIRRLLNIKSSLPEPPSVEWEDDDALKGWIDLKARASEMAAMGDFDDVDVLEGDTLADILDSMDVDEFAELCVGSIQGDADALDSPFLPLVRWLDAPMGPDLFRRVAHLLLAAKAQPTSDRFKLLNAACVSANVQLPTFVTNLLGADFVKDASDLLGNLKGILTDLGLGETALLQQVREAWDKNTSTAFNALKKRWGPVLTDDLLDRIAADVGEAQALLDALAREGVSIYDLADVIRRPPEYLFATRRFASAGPEWDKALHLWSGRFGLANLAQGLDWHFFLGDASTLIVKLGDRRSIEDILRETHERFRTAERPDPLGLASLDPAKETFDGGLARLKEKLGPTLLAPSWTGLLILRPTADISEDVKMRDLCGLEYIDALYVAVAGRPLGSGSLDVSAAIESRSEDESVAELKGRGPNEWKGDVDFGLTRFSVVIRRSVLDAADIAFQLRVKNLMGKDHPEKPEAAGVQTITIRGTLPPADPAHPERSRDIQFAAVLVPPMRIPIGLLCFESVAFAGLRVGLHDSRTFLDIDADIKLQNSSADGYPDFLESIEQLKLRGFRIALPSLQFGEARAIGEAIGLDFEWPSVEFSAPRSRAIKLFGLELTPLALGILRKAGDNWERFKEKFIEVENWGLPALGAVKTEVPYIRFRASFGSLPALGVSGKLSFDLVFGLLVVNGAKQRPFIAVEGIEGNKITLDLFRLITVTIEKLVFKQNWTLKLGDSTVAASGLVADRVELKLLNWNPLGKGGQLSLASFHRTDNQDEYQPHGFVVGYEKKANAGSSSAGSASKGFVKIHWIVLGQNIELRKEAYDYLLASGFQHELPGADTKSLLTELLVYQDAEDKNNNLPGTERKPREFVDGLLGAAFTKSPSWLFAISFSLGDVLELGNLVLHDQHYYGIRLRDRRWVQAVFGQDTIEFAYIPGARRELDRFRTNLRIPLLDMLGPMTSGEVSLEWALNWDFLIDIGFPWKTSAGHNWFRAFSLPVGTYEGKFGFYMEKKTTYEVVPDSEVLLLGCGAALYVGIYVGFGNSIAYVRAGIGVFGIFEGRFWLKNANLSRPELLKATVVRVELSGTIGIFAYAEGRIEVWIISASFRAWAEASLTTTVIYLPGATCAIAYSAVLAAGYSASVCVGSGWFSWTFSVSGYVAMPVSGRLLLA